MQDSPLNKAHQLQRRADALLKQRKFDDCMDAHKIATQLLRDALQLSDNPRSLQSLQLQHDHHRRQIDSVIIQKVQYEQRKHNLDKQKRQRYCHNIVENDESLQARIFRTFDEQDSLVEAIVRRGNGDDKQASIDECDAPKPGQVGGIIRNVDNATVMEEFQLSNASLRESVLCLFGIVEERDKQIIKLNARIYELECEKKDRGQSKSNNSLKVITDSSGGTSPYVFSPCSELSPDIADLRPLPSLAPLELPSFDFQSFVKNGSALNNTLID